LPLKKMILSLETFWKKKKKEKREKKSLHTSPIKPKKERGKKEKIVVNKQGSDLLGQRFADARRGEKGKKGWDYYPLKGGKRGKKGGLTSWREERKKERRAGSL